MNTRRKWLAPFGMWIVFEIVAVTLWLTKDNLFYLLNFSYIGTSITVGLLLFQFNYKHARRIVQLLVEQNRCAMACQGCGAAFFFSIIK